MKRPLAVWSAASGLKIDLKNEQYSAPVLLNLAAPHFGVKNYVPQSSRTAFPERDFRVGSSIPRQFPPAPMMLFAIGIKLPLNVAVQGPHDTDARKHRRAAQR